MADDFDDGGMSRDVVDDVFLVEDAFNGWVFCNVDVASFFDVVTVFGRGRIIEHA